jgi:hypothetical protein
MRRLLTRRGLTLLAAGLVGLIALFAVVGALHSAGQAPLTASPGHLVAGSAENFSSAGSGLAASAPDATPASSAASVPGATFSPAGVQAAAVASGSTLASVQAHYLVRTGSLAITVAKGHVAAVASRVGTITEGLGGYVVSDQYSSSTATPLPEPASAGGSGIMLPPNGPYAVVTVRSPASSFATAVAEFSRLGKIESISTQTEDVTAQYVDLGARLAHYRAVQARLLTFLARTTSVGQALAVQQQMDATELTVEQLTGELKALRQTVVYATLTVAISEQPLAAVAHHNTSSFPSAFLRSLRLIGSGAQASFVGLGAAAPFVVLAALVGVAASLLVRRRRREHSQNAA